MTITEFLTARWDEEEAIAREAKESRVRFGDAQGDDAFDEAANLAENEGAMSEVVYFIRRQTPQSVLADIAAKRAIVALITESVEEPYIQELMLNALAQPCAEHADFDPEWRV